MNHIRLNCVWTLEEDTQAWWLVIGPYAANSYSQGLVDFVSVFATLVATSEATASEALSKKPCHLGTSPDCALEFSWSVVACWQGFWKHKDDSEIVSLIPPPLHSASPLWESLLHELYFSFPRRLLFLQNVPIYCPSSAGEEEGKHFRLLSLVYVIVAGAFNFQDKWCISGTGHTGSHSARELSAHAVLSEQSTDLNGRQLAVIIKCVRGGWLNEILHTDETNVQTSQRGVALKVQNKTTVPMEECLRKGSLLSMF